MMTAPINEPASPRRDIPVSVIIMTKNEEANMEACLSRLDRFEQVFVVDSNSTDATCEIAKAHGAEVVNFSWNGQYPKKKQWCLENLPFRHEWVLYVDADEHMYPELAEEIARLLAAGAPEHAGYFVRFDGFFMGKVLRHGHFNLKLVLMRRDKARFIDVEDLDVASMWEVEGHYQPVIEGTVGKLRGRMLHRDFKSLYHYFERHNRYSDWEAKLRLRDALSKPDEAQLPGRRTLKYIFDRIPAKGPALFVFNYFVRLGLLDGWAGFNYAISRSIYYWQIEAKIAELRQIEN